MLGDILAVDKHPILGAIGIVIVALCHGNQDKLQPHGPLSSSTDLIVLHTINCALNEVKGKEERKTEKLQVKQTCSW